MTYKEIIKNKEINAYLKKGNENLGQLGYTDHSQKHCMQVAHQAGKILKSWVIRNMRLNSLKLQVICMILEM